MRPIQWLLIPLLGFLMMVFSQKLKAHPVLRWVVIGLFLLAMGVTMVPDSSTWIANQLGIGRGVDLIIYLSLLGLAVACLILYLRTVKLERQLTQIIRKQSIEEARPASAVAGMGDLEEEEIDSQ
ncbi:DUF2304 domain-containing protein [Pontibacter sp. G13]|uniref:DUF2304 domain-containing protein n=1 Tax=Pontibacter sp. G13 TaxID=3074898 RepID=UPI00288AC1D2|nr:DUF2304 domain-containing protein [Pontibacter sp. G13]WNJ18688.1 DUF2304 domain-containing protein [Pontibacter sp. G13]